MGQPTTNPGLLANLVARVILAFAGILVSWVPLRLLIRNGEFAAVVFIVDVAILNFITILNSIIWHNDNWSKWYDGQGLCDIEVYISGPLQTIYAASIFTIMYHLAQQVKIKGAVRGRSEKLRRNLIQSAIIFPIPLIQLLFTWFDLAQRYIVGTLIGCSAVYDASWPKILIYDAPPAIFALLAVPYAVLLWKRYRAIAKEAQGILKSGGAASLRANRTRRRLFNMSFSILLVYVPVMMYFLVANIKDTLASYRAYDYRRMHWSATPYPWETILFVPSWLIPSDIMNLPWIPIATAAVILMFFGMTTDALKTYRHYREYVGIDTWFRSFRQKGGKTSSPPGDSDRTVESGRALLPLRARDSPEYRISSRGKDTVLPTIERDDTAQPTETQAQAHKPSPARTRTTINSPPAIPPRFSSLRPSFGFRTPTFQSISRSMRISSLWSRAASGASVSDASNATTGERTDSNRNNSVPMLPLHNMPRRSDAGSRREGGLFWARDIPEGIARAQDNVRPGSRSRLEIRVPITQQGPVSDARGGRAVDAGMARSHLAEQPSFPREPTLGSMCTTTDTRTSKSGSTVGQEENAAAGIAN
ncbi:pheromone A receptor-domain-containing protein [Astrocystis sublimbata]|nr:pheromone A receptor-domain-containing protein [Astrocystis sublimbata]